MDQIATVSSYTPTCFVSGLDAEPVLPCTGQGSRNKCPGGGHSALLQQSPRLGVFGFSVLITERVSDLYHFGCAQMSERFRVPLRHVAPRTERKGRWIIQTAKSQKELKGILNTLPFPDEQNV